MTAIATLLVSEIFEN